MSSIRRQTVVLPGGKVELTVPELTAGETLNVVLTREEPSIERRQAFLRHLQAHPGPRSAQEWESYDRELRAERDAWEK